MVRRGALESRGIAAGALLALTLTWASGCGDDRKQRADPFAGVHPEQVSQPREAAPRWSKVTAIAGSGPTTRRFTIASGALHWRARWSCATGRLVVRVQIGPTLARSACPARGVGDSAQTGAVRLAVAATGRWKVRVEQELDTPLREALLPEMVDGRARVLARGKFHAVEQPGSGTATLYGLPHSRLALRFTGFSTAKNTDLFVWLSRARAPTTSKQAFHPPHLVLAPLKSTLGDQNYLLPRGVPRSAIRSIVIWCQPVSIAYTAAALRESS